MSRQPVDGTTDLVFINVHLLIHVMFLSMLVLDFRVQTSEAGGGGDFLGIRISHEILWTPASEEETRGKLPETGVIVL